MFVRPITTLARLIPGLLIATVVHAQGTRVPDAYDTLTVQGDLPATFPIELEGSQVIVEDVHINGQGPFRFMLDTGGMGGGRVDTSLAKKLDLVQTGEVQGSDGTGRAGPMMPQYQLDSLRLGSVEFTDVRILSRDYNEFGAAVRGHIDGILGFHLFEELLLTLDYPGQQLVIDQGALPEVDAQTILPMKLDGGVPEITIVIDGTPHSAHLDSGAMAPLSISEAIAASLEFNGEPRVVGEARTVSGTFEVKAAQLKGNAQIGAHTLESPDIVIGAPLRGVNIGGDILTQFVTTFDQKHQRVRFERPDNVVVKPRPKR